MGKWSFTHSYAIMQACVENNSANMLKPLDQFEFHHLLEESQGIAIVMFFSQGCSACAAWESLLLQYQQLHPAIALFQVDAQSEPALVHELEVFHLPSLFLYLNGQYHCQLQSEARLSRFEQAMQTAINRPAQDLP